MSVERLSAAIFHQQFMSDVASTVSDKEWEITSNLTDDTVTFFFRITISARQQWLEPVRTLLAIGRMQVRICEWLVLKNLTTALVLDEAFEEGLVFVLTYDQRPPKSTRVWIGSNAPGWPHHTRDGSLQIMPLHPEQLAEIAVNTPQVIG